MSDSAIFISISAEDLNQNGQLPGDLRSLRNLMQSGERVVHVELVCDAPLPEKTLNVLHMSGATVTVLPSSNDSTAALTGGLMARLHEFMCAYPHVAQFVLAGADVDRLDSVSLFLQRAGYYVIVAGPDRSRLDAVRNSCDDVAVWGSGRQPRDRDKDRDKDRDSSNTREPKTRESAPKLDPYEVLVEEVTKGRKKGSRVLLTSLKQRIRKRIRRFDETRLKDLEGRPMKQFKDFVIDAVNRELIQLVEKGNASHVLLPGEDIPEDTDEDDVDVVDTDESNDQDNDANDDRDVDPLLDNVDMVEEKKEEPKDLPPLTEKDFHVNKVNEEAPAPSQEFMVFIDNLIPKEGLALGELLLQLHQAQSAGHLELTNRKLKSELQNAFYNELLETVNDDEPAQYVVVDDWKDIIDFL
jgi:hypothetical protein